jgi:transcriptional regulator with XRE-family HTH domain
MIVATITTGRVMSTTGSTAIRDSRLHLGLTQQQVADRLGVTRAAVQQYESSEERGVISLATLRNALAVLGGSVAVTPAQPASAAPRRLFLGTPELLASAVRDSRAALGLTASQVADQASTSREVVEAMEASRPVSDISAVVRVLRAVNIRPYAIPSPAAG